jgi:hypothetical protein
VRTVNDLQMLCLTPAGARALSTVSHRERPVSRPHQLAWAQLWPAARGSVLRVHWLQSLHCVFVESPC